MNATTQIGFRAPHKKTVFANVEAIEMASFSREMTPGFWKSSHGPVGYLLGMLRNLMNWLGVGRDLPILVPAFIPGDLYDPGEMKLVVSGENLDLRSLASIRPININVMFPNGDRMMMQGFTTECEYNGGDEWAIEFKLTGDVRMLPALQHSYTNQTSTNQ